MASHLQCNDRIFKAIDVALVSTTKELAMMIYLGLEDVVPSSCTCYSIFAFLEVELITPPPCCTWNMLKKLPLSALPFVAGANAGMRLYWTQVDAGSQAVVPEMCSFGGHR